MIAKICFHENDMPYTSGNSHRAWLLKINLQSKRKEMSL